jgi:cyanate permease
MEATLPCFCAGPIFFVAARCLRAELWLVIAMLAVPSGAVCRCWRSLVDLLVDLMFACRKCSGD